MLLFRILLKAGVERFISWTERGGDSALKPSEVYVKTDSQKDSIENLRNKNGSLH